MRLIDKTGLSLLSKNKIARFITKTSVLCVAMASVGLTACDPLGVEPTDKVFEDDFWTNAQLSRAYVYKFYTWAPVTANQYFTSEQWSDNAIGNDETDWTSYRQNSFYQRTYDALNGIDGFSGPWGDQYKKIRATNLGIERIPTVPSIQESVMNQLLAECHFFRGWLYFELEQYWGGVPYVDRVMNVFDETMLPRITREELFDKVLADFDKSLEYFSKTEETPQLGLVNADAVQTIKSRVALFTGYNENERYPVMYMFDGHNLFDDAEATFGKSWGLEAYLDYTDTQVIIAAVECNHDGDKRLEEYSPVNFVCDGKKIKGNGAKYMKWLVSKFKPFIDKNYSTLPDRANTAIGGSSMGGLMTLYALSKFNKYFSKGAALSPSVWACGGVPEFIKSAKYGKDTVLYTDYGSKEFSNHNGMKALFAQTTATLIEKGVFVTSRIVPHGTHSEASWEKCVPYFMDILFPDL